MNREDPLLQAVAREAQETELLADPRWAELCSGALSPEVAAALKAEAARAGGRAAQAYEAFRPLDESDHAAIAATLIARRRPVSPPPKARPRWARRALAIAVPLAAAAALAVALRAPHGSPSLPPYAVAVDEDAATRGDAPPPEARRLARVDPDGELRLVLRPQAEPRGPVTARAFVVTATGARRWDAALETRPHGAMRLVGSAREAFAGARTGRFTVVVAVGPADGLPADAAILERIHRGDIQASPGEPAELARVEVEVAEAR
jgi:hypothetical protein